MPPKARISKEMIVEEAFQIARTEGADKITARSISQRLKCSTQPVPYYFKTVEEIKAAVYEQSDEVEPVMQVLQQEAVVTMDEAREIFTTLFVFVHGYASMFANNEMAYDEKLLETSLTKVFYGVVYAAKEVKDEEVIFRGFLFTIIFYKGISLWPCIITHGVLNSLGVFSKADSRKCP